MEVTNDLRRNRIGSGWAGLRGDRASQDEPAGFELGGRHGSTTR